jgi:hypothetical protein
MKLTKTHLLDLIKEEIEAILSEQPRKPLQSASPPGAHPEYGFKSYRRNYGQELEAMTQKAILDNPGYLRKHMTINDTLMRKVVEWNVDFVLDTVEGYFEASQNGYSGPPNKAAGRSFILKKFKDNMDRLARTMQLKHIKGNAADPTRQEMFDRFSGIVLNVVNKFNDFYRSAEKSRYAAIDAKYEKEKAEYDAARARGDYTNKLPAGSRANQDLRKVSDYLKSSSKRSTPSISDPARAASVGSRMGGLNEEKKDKSQLILEDHRENRKVHPVAKDNWWYDA